MPFRPTFHSLFNLKAAKMRFPLSTHKCYYSFYYYCSLFFITVVVLDTERKGKRKLLCILCNDNKESDNSLEVMKRQICSILLKRHWKTIRLVCDKSIQFNLWVLISPDLRFRSPLEFKTLWFAIASAQWMKARSTRHTRHRHNHWSHMAELGRLMHVTELKHHRLWLS